MIMAKDTNNVRELIKDIKFNLPYLHFKGKLVVPLDVTINAQTDKLEILYICLNNGNKYTREVEQWFTDISHRKDNTTGNKLRFELFNKEVKEY